MVVLAARYRTQDVLTLDERHFRVLQANRKPLRLLPADARTTTRAGIIDPPDG